MIRRLAILFSVAALAMFAASACKKDTAAPESAPEPEFLEELGAAPPPRAAIGDYVVVELNVVPARHLEFDPERPVEVYPPSGVPFEFEKNVYAIERFETFPLEVPFLVTNEAKKGEYELKFGMRIFYRARADNARLTRTEMITVPVRIIPVRRSGPEKHAYRIEYMLE
ncbi:hypothetical protein K8I61_10320 [bacterium]|nr:hypothetical protein [bacterium]